MFSCEFYEVSKNVFLTEHLRWLLSNKREMRTELRKTPVAMKKAILYFFRKLISFFL